MKKGCWGYPGYISWMAKLPWLEKKGWVRQAVAGRSQDSGRSSSSSGWRRQSERRQRVGEAQPANSFTLTTTNLFSTDAQNTSEKVVNILISEVHWWEGRLDNKLVTTGFNPYRWVRVNSLGPSLFSFNRGRIGNSNYSLSVAAG